MIEIPTPTSGEPKHLVRSEKLVEIANLEVDCKIGKDRHFIAADRKNRWRIILGMFSVIGSAIMASESGPALSKLIQSYFSDDKHVAGLLGFLGTLLPLLVGISTAIIGFLGLEKQTAQHRFVGNSYIEIARKARSLINDINANTATSADYLGRYEKLLTHYLEVNKEGEGYPTNKKDSDKAMQMNEKRRSAVKAKLMEFDAATLGLKEKQSLPKLNLRTAIARGTKLKFAAIFFKIGIIRKSDYKKILTSL